MPSRSPQSRSRSSNGFVRTGSSCSAAKGVISYELGVKLELMELAPTYRNGGDDRYSTAVEISKAHARTRRVRRLRRERGDFSDALAGAPVAGLKKGPILLSVALRILPVVTSELRRLRPAKIVILGGTGVIDSRVASQLETLTAGTVTRLAGTDRYATSAAISKSMFLPGVPVAWHRERHANFPDALAGAPVAGMRKGPVLLTDRGSVPKVVLDELKRPLLSRSSSSEVAAPSVPPCRSNLRLWVRT